MLIRHKGRALLGLLLGVSFFVVLALLFTPLFGGQDGLVSADGLFNRLAKGSSYAVPQLSASVRKVEGQDVAVSVKMGSAEQAATALKVFSKAAAETTADGAVLNVKGDLAKLLGAALRDSDAMYFNKADELRATYGMDGRAVLLSWYTALSGTAAELLKGNRRSIAQSKIVQSVATKGVEPAYNFYGIQPESVSRRAGPLTFLLTFYLGYTLWWGFAIYFLFDGCGLAMTKARVKREV